MKTKNGVKIAIAAGIGILGMVLIAATMLSVQGCGTDGVSIQIDDTSREGLARAAGFNIAYFTLQNNPDYVAIVEVPLRTTIMLASDDATDVQALNTMIVDYILERSDDPELAQYKAIIQENLRLLQDLVIVGIDLSLPENAKTALGYIRAFLDGALAGLEAVKAQG